MIFMFVPCISNIKIPLLNPTSALVASTLIKIKIKIKSQ
jgi:hypothetical protein